MTVSDNMNHSRVARRVVLFDNTSQITLDPHKPLFVSSAVAETGYTWQTQSTGAVGR